MQQVFNPLRQLHGWIILLRSNGQKAKPKCTLCTEICRHGRTAEICARELICINKVSLKSDISNMATFPRESEWTKNT